MVNYVDIYDMEVKRRSRCFHISGGGILMSRNNGLAALMYTGVLLLQ